MLMKDWSKPLDFFFTFEYTAGAKNFAVFRWHFRKTQIEIKQGDYYTKPFMRSVFLRSQLNWTKWTPGDFLHKTLEMATKDLQREPSLLQNIQNCLFKFWLIGSADLWNTEKVTLLPKTNTIRPKTVFHSSQHTDFQLVSRDMKKKIKLANKFRNQFIIDR